MHIYPPPTSTMPMMLAAVPAIVRRGRPTTVSATEEYIMMLNLPLSMYLLAKRVSGTAQSSPTPMMMPAIPSLKPLE